MKGGEGEGKNPQSSNNDTNKTSNNNGQDNTNSNNSGGEGNNKSNSNNSNNPAPNNNSSNPGPSSSSANNDVDPTTPTTTTEGGLAPIEVITTPPQEDLYGDQAQAVPPAAANPQDPGGDNDDAASNVSSSLVAYQFKQFTKESYQNLLDREAEFKQKAKDKKDRPSEGRLVDGELVYDGEEGDEPPLERDPNLVEGNTLPEHLEQDFPKELFSKPIEEIDSLIKDKTFVVITKRFKKTHIHRFSATKSFFLLAPWNPLRRAAIYVATSQVFDYFIILTILTNCIFLALPAYSFVEDAENVWLAIYSVEAVVKLTARGFILNSNTYLRDPWNWLDFIIIISAYVTLGLGNQQGILDSIRPFRVFRAIKTISIVPGLKTIVGALLKSMRMLAEVILLTLFVMVVFALFTLQVYIGILRHKCVVKIPEDVQLSHYEYSLHLKNESNWIHDGDNYVLCGNSTGARQCPNTHTCLPDIGPNPNFGYTSFDNIGWALLTSFQLITLDFWEDTYNKVIEANGPLNIIFFAVVVFFGSFYLINLMLAVVSMSYEEEALQAGKMEKEKERKREKRERKDRKEKERKERAAAAAATAAADSALAAAAAEGAGEGSTDPGGNASHPGGGAKQGTTNNNETTTSDTNHLQLVGGNVNGSNSASNVSLNGLLPPAVDLPGVKGPPKNSVKKEVDSSAGKGGLGGNNKGDLQGGGVEDREEKRPTGSTEQLVTTDGLGDTNKVKVSTPEYIDEKIGHQNPIAEDDHSIISIDNQGDAPDVIIKDDEDDLVDRNCQCCARCCHGYPNWLKFQNFFYRIVTDIVFELFISFCIVINVLAMAIEHYNMNPAALKTLDDMNLVFTVIFTLEAFIKLLAMSKDFFTSAWNIFDLIVVALSFADLGSGSLGSLKVIRLVRLLRVFRLAQTWSTMRVLISIIFRTLGAMGNLILILILCIYILAVFGMQVFGKSYTPEKFYPDDVPRWNFSDFFHAILLVFRVLCGEWIEPLWDCMRAAGETCMLVFFPTLVLGNFVVLNLFLALMLNSFATDSLNKGKEELKEDKMKEGWNKLKGLFKPKSSAVEPHEGMESKKPSIADIVEELKRHQKAVYEGDEEESRSVKSARSKLSIVDEDNRVKEIELNTLNDDSVLEAESAQNAKNMTKNNKNPSNGVIKTKKSTDISKAFQTDRSEFSEFTTAMTVSSKKKEDEIEEEADPKSEETPAKSRWGGLKGKEKDKKAADKKKSKEEGSDDEEGEGETQVQDCFPAFCYTCACCECCHRLEDTSCGHGWTRFREIVHKITEHKVFEYFIVIVILASSVTLCFEDIWIYRNAELREVLKYLNIVFAAVFITEMLLKWIALGFKTYFTSFWTVLDFCIVIITLLTLASESLGLEQVSAFRGLRTLRALRPLRAVSRWQGMKIVVNALFYAIPAICNVLMVCAIFWLLFAIGGYQFFGGRFRKCVDADGEKLPYELVPNKQTCLDFQANGTGYSWVNAKINFDNVWVGYLALLQVATFEGWMEVMEDAVDMTSYDQQPRFEATFSAYWFFVTFILIGSFFTLNLFIGVIIENFNSLKKKYEGGYVDIFLTASQKNYYNTMKKLGNRKPQKTIKRPKNKVQGFFFDVAVSTKFELAIVLLILLNMSAMALERYHQSEAYTDALDIINIIFTTIFALEAIVKIIGLRWHYFRRMWNVFDLIIVILSIIGVVLDDLLRDIFITPTLLRVVRVFRIGRVLRLIKAAKGIRKLLFALVISIPALLNIGMLLFILMFMYAIFGMSLFGEVRHRGALNDVTNFETFFNSFVLLFRLTTAAGWNDILDPMMEEHDCNNTHRVMPDGDIKKIENGDCGNSIGAALYMASYVIVTYLIIINMYIAVILENFNQAHEQEEVGITEDDFEMFYVVWERYDPHATQFIKVECLSDLVADLDLPLGIPKPNEIALVAFDLPIMEGERLHCLDVLTSLVKHVLGGVEDTEEFRNLKSQMEERYRSAFPTRVTQIQISSTMKRKKEDVAAKTLQRAWRKHKATQSIRKITSMAMEAKLNKSLSRTSFSGASSSSPPTDRPSSSTSSTTSIKVAPSPTKKLGNTLTVPSAERA